MGAGCSSSAANSIEPPELEVPSRPAYLAGDLVGPPVTQKSCIGTSDRLISQASTFAETLCQLNDSLSGILLDVRLATGLLQGGFSISLSPSPIVDFFSVELLTKDGLPLHVTEAARLRGRALSGQSRLAALDARLAECLEGLAEYFVQHVGTASIGLALSPAGTLVPRNPALTSAPAVEAFNEAILAMRSALGEDYLLALHLHKASGHGMPSFRVSLLKPPPPSPPDATTPVSPSSPYGTTDPIAIPILPGSTAPAPGAGVGAPGAPLAGWRLATLLDRAACPGASPLHDALHAYYDANGQLAAAIKRTGLTGPGAIQQTSPRTVALAGTAPSSSASPVGGKAPSAAASHGNPARSPGRPHRPLLTPSTTTPRNGAAASGPSFSPSTSSPSSTAATPTTAAAAGASAVRSLPDASRAVVGRAVEGLNAAAHRLAQAAAEAPGPASFAALLTHVLGELRDLVARCGGEAALESYRPLVYFSLTPDQPTLSFNLDPQLEGPRAAGWGRGIPPFPDCLSPQVRRAWRLLLELLRMHNSTVVQLGQLGELAAVFEEGIRRRIATASDDAAASRLSLKEAAAATRALVWNHVEIMNCCQAALHTLAATAQLVRQEMAEAAQLAEVQCSFMSPLAWSLSLASTSATAPPSLASLSSVPALASHTGTYAGAYNGGAAGATASSTSATITPPPVGSRFFRADRSLATAPVFASPSPSPGADPSSPPLSSVSPHPPLSTPSISSPGSLHHGASGSGGGGSGAGTPRALPGGGGGGSSSHRWVAGSGGGGGGSAAASPCRSLTSSPTRGGGIRSGSGGGASSASSPALPGAPDSAPDTTPGNDQMQQASLSYISPAAGGSGNGGEAAAGVGSRSVRMAGSTSRTVRSNGSQGGWVPVGGQADPGAAGGANGAAAAASTPPLGPKASSASVVPPADGSSGSGGGEGASQRLLRRAARSIGSRLKAEASAGAELADEYARTALAHLRLQNA